MIVNVENLLAMDEFKEMEKEALNVRLRAVEGVVRSYTNNNFQNRRMRLTAPAIAGAIHGSCPYFKTGDTVQISQSGVNDGLYEITEISENKIRVEGELYDTPYNMLTKVVYPVDVQKGVIDLMIWEVKNRAKVGIKSETLSRHSVTYYEQDSENQVMGYPVSLLGFLKPYIVPRF